ncbi:MAG TPA: hypothetical protein VF796_11235 [Humisphaera sp.]
MPAFLTRDEVLALHTDQVARYGGSPGLSDGGLLDMPQQGFGGRYVHSDLPSMAAASTTLSATTRSSTGTSGSERWPPTCSC